MLLKNIKNVKYIKLCGFCDHQDAIMNKKYVTLQSDYYEGVLRSLRSGVLIVMLLARHDG